MGSTEQSGDFAGHDFAVHFTDACSQSVPKNFCGQGVENLPARSLTTIFGQVGLAVGCRRRKQESCQGQTLPYGRPSFLTFKHCGNASVLRRRCLLLRDWSA